jgi:hypothetical protein
MIRETIALNRELSPAGMQFSVFYPYPMTELHDVCVEEGYLGDDAQLNGYYGRQTVLDLPTLSQVELEREYDRFTALKWELQMKRASPMRHRVFQGVRLLCGGDALRAQGIWRSMRRLKGTLGRLLGRSAPIPQASSEGAGE